MHESYKWCKLHCNSVYVSSRGLLSVCVPLYFDTLIAFLYDVSPSCTNWTFTTWCQSSCLLSWTPSCCRCLRRLGQWPLSFRWVCGVTSALMHWNGCNLTRWHLKHFLVSLRDRQHKLFNKELYADFIAAQIKTLSFLAYIIRIYQVAWLWKT